MGFKQQFLNALLASIFVVPFCLAVDSITPTKSIRDGNTIISIGGVFALGFFSPNNSANRYIGIWYNNILEQTVVWVANRENPVTGSRGSMTINSDGNLIISDGAQNILWSTNLTLPGNWTCAKLLDSGNLVLSNNNSEAVLWQSFDYPGNTFLPGMKLGLNRRTGRKWSITSWSTQTNPAPGEFSIAIDPRGAPEFFIRAGTRPYARSGPWNGLTLSGAPYTKPYSVLNYSCICNDDEISCVYHLLDNAIISRAILDESGTLQRWTWINENRQWNLYWSNPSDLCDHYALCGPYGGCNSQNNAPVCGCLQGFKPKSPGAWFLGDRSGGCTRKIPLVCGAGDGFYKLKHVKLPDTSSCRVDLRLNLYECEKQCLNNCSCTAYAPANISGRGSGCLTWYGDLIDIKEYSDLGQDLYVRVAASELVGKSFQGKKKMLVIISLAVFVGMVLLVICYYYCRKKMKDLREMPKSRGRWLFDAGNKRKDAKDLCTTNELEESKEGMELPLFDFDTVAAATNNFSPENKVGEGGFGPVYKGMLADGQEIAVKRLSKHSNQGLEEYKSEVISIAKLQHRNLVRLLGCCLEGQAKMLIYEYMPNKSLNYFIFDKSRGVLLDWRKRFEIIVGIARGILYLHQDSRLRIVHRDLKLSNILLDAEMNPKISDFGMARIFIGNQTEANTKRVVGTCGYMSPEYAMVGLFSTKSDVFSFGVLLLEIVSGCKNSCFDHEEHSLNLVGHVWNMWKEGRGLEILDSTIRNSCVEEEVLRSIHVGLLCVQENAIDRPTMSSVFLMLSAETRMPPPKQPAYFSKRTCIDGDSSNGRTRLFSINEVTISDIDGR